MLYCTAPVRQDGYNLIVDNCGDWEHGRIGVAPRHESARPLRRHSSAIPLGLLVSLMLSLTPCDGAAQTFQGGVRGAVRDADGVVPGADVALVNEETAVERTTITNPVGEYAFPNVAPGVYTLRAALSGFKTFESRGIRVGTQEFLTLDLRLEVGEVREAITVTGRITGDRLHDRVGGNLIERRTLETLPNVGRNPFVISTITPNVIPTGVPQFTRMQDQNATAMLSLGGGPRRANNFLLDGVPITDLFNRAAIIPSLEAVEEVKVQVSTYDAELGRTGGGVFNTTHKSGSNAWRGSALILERPEWGTGTLFFTKQAGQPKPETFHHQWAASVGGPISRNRTFFWASTEGYKTQTTSNSALLLPTAAERRGDYSQSFDAQGRLIVIHDPLTTRPNPAIPGQFIRDPFPGNVIPPARINPVARNLVNLLPLPDTGRALTSESLPIGDFTNQATGKLDHRLTDRQTLSGTFAWYHSREPAPQYLGVDGDPNAVFQPRTVNVVAINDVWRAVRSHGAGCSATDICGFATISRRPRQTRSSLGVRAGVCAVPSPDFRASLCRATRISRPSSRRTQTESTSYSHSANFSLSWLAGRHTVKVGGEYRLIGMRVFAPGDVNGTFAFSANFTQGPNPNTGGTNSGDVLASLLLGYPASGAFNVGTRNDFYTNYFAGFVQDDFRWGSNVSVNVGVRYELEPGLRERNNAMVVGFDRDRPFPVQAPGLDLKGGLMYAGVDGYPEHQGNPSTLNFGPRAGIAWSLDSKTVVRGGYGLFWAPRRSRRPSTRERWGREGSRRRRHTRPAPMAD